MIYNPKNDKPLCPCCFRQVYPHYRGKGMCRECYEIWLEWDRTRLKALEAAVVELDWHGFGQVRIARILGISVAQVRGVFRSKLPDRKRDGKFSLRRHEPRLSVCLNPACEKTFEVRDKRSVGKYCCVPCRKDVQRTNIKLIVELAKQGYSRAEVMAKTGLSRDHINRHWAKRLEPAEGKTKYASTLTAGDLGNDPTYCG